MITFGFTIIILLLCAIYLKLEEIEKML